jgi:dTDP-4-amino-4,6-dideoxygalactose transaminase
MEPMKVRMFDLARHYQRDRSEIDAAIHDVLSSGQPIMGPAVKAFEDDFAHYCGVRHAAGVTSGTSALLVALRALDIGRGDEVITVANSDIPTSHAVTLTGARVVWVDIDPLTWNIDVGAVEAAISPRTKAILPVHLYGTPADMGPLLELADRSGLFVVEDACLAPGAYYRGRRVGSFGTLGAFSTAPGKPLGGVGSGGVVTTDDAGLYERINQLRNYGRERPLYRTYSRREPKPASQTVVVGFNERLDTIDAAVLRIRLRRLDADRRRRAEIAAIYERRLAAAGVRVPRPLSDTAPTWYVYTVGVPDRDRVYTSLVRDGYDVAMYYLPANHLDACYRHLGYRPGSLPVTERFCEELLSLPCHQFLSDEDAEQVAAALIALL